MKSKIEILNGCELETATVLLESWGGDVTVRTLTALERDRLEQNWKKLGRADGDWAGFSAFVVAHTVTNGNGELFFNPAEDFEALCNKPSKEIVPLFNAACRLSALTKSDQEELVKN